MRESWPKLPAIQLSGKDLPADERGAGRLITSAMKSPDAIAAVKSKLRRARVLSDIYPLQRRVFELAYARRAISRTLPGRNPPSPETSQNDDGKRIIDEMLAAERSFKDAKRNVIQTWIEYQAERSLDSP